MQNSQQSQDSSPEELFAIFSFYNRILELQKKKSERGVRELDVLNDPNNWYDPFKPKEPECQSTTS